MERDSETLGRFVYVAMFDHRGPMPLWGCDFYVIVGKSIFQNAIPWALTFLFERMPFIIKVLCNSPHKGIICFDIET